MFEDRSLFDHFKSDFRLGIVEGMRMQLVSNRIYAHVMPEQYMQLLTDFVQGHPYTDASGFSAALSRLLKDLLRLSRQHSRNPVLTSAVSRSLGAVALACTAAFDVMEAVVEQDGSPTVLENARLARRLVLGHGYPTPGFRGASRGTLDPYDLAR